MTDDRYGLAGRNAFIAGGTSGINLGIAHAFVAAGMRVFVLSRDAGRVAQAVSALREAGEADGVAADVRDYDAIADAAATAAERFGPIDVAVAGAAGNFIAPAAQMSSNGFRTVVEIDLLGSFHVARAAYPHLRRPGASVIAISAPQAAKPMLGQAHVCAAKAGVNMLIRTLALEWGPEGIRANAISPGPIGDTEGMRRLAPDEAGRAAITDALALRRFGTIEEIAELACFLASERASYITGTVIDADGGTMLGSGGLT